MNNSEHDLCFHNCFLKRFYYNPYLHVQIKQGPLLESKHLNFPPLSENVLNGQNIAICLPVVACPVKYPQKSTILLMFLL